jgi:predicted short-subunit dehydrogenase-like oxidoreductase (DUF2520 family)
MNQFIDFVCIGAGNVATHLVKGLCDKGYRLIQVYSRTIDSANALAGPYGAKYTNSLSEITDKSDFYLFSVPDQVLPEILNQFKTYDRLAIHTAGSHGLEVFGKNFKHFGVLYPLQTISKNVKLNIAEIPFLIEASDNQSIQEIEKIARSVSEKVYITDTESRRWIHLAASNFTNHMVALSTEILNQKNLDPALLRPLIEETFRKSLVMDPTEAQTGPAVRNDFIIIDKHIKMLQGQSLMQKIYTFTSESIQVTKSSKQNKSGK